GARSAWIDIAGLAVELEGLPDALADSMAARYHPYIGPASGACDALRIEVVSAPVDYFLVPGFPGKAETYRVVTALEGTMFRSVSYWLAAWFDTGLRAGQVALGHGDLDPLPRAMENFLRSAIAWLAIDRGGFLLHGASIVRDGACFLFYGPSGAGKSTLAAMSPGGTVISDDLTLLLGTPGGLRAAGGPFRGTYTAGAPVVGTFPVAGLYRLRKDSRTRVEADDGGCFADLVGNLPFVVDLLPGRPDLIDRVRSLVEGTRLRYLHFGRGRDFWTAIDAERGV
ncbi:MAG: hypothetical protein ACE5JH_08825, partial [Acidobacteriota bacterium]